MWYTTLYTRHRGFFNHGGELCARSSQSIKIGIDVSIDKSKKTGKSDLIDIDCIDQSVEIDGTLVLLIDLSWFLPICPISHLFICSSKNENWIHANSKFTDF